MAFNPNSLNETTIKRFVDKLVQQNKQKDTWPPKRAFVQEDVAVMLGYKNWHELKKCIKDLSTPSNEKPPTHTQIHLPYSSLTENSLLIPELCDFEKVTGHILLKSADKKRRQYFDQLAALNPHIHFLFVQGQNSLPFVSSHNRPFFNYDAYKHIDRDTRTVLDHSFLTPNLCNAIANFVAYTVGQNQYFDAIQEYVLHALLNTNLGPHVDAFELMGETGHLLVLKYFSDPPSTMPKPKNQHALESFWSDAHLVATTATTLWCVLKSLATKSFTSALTSSTPSLGIRLYEPMDVPLDNLGVFCDVWMHLHAGPKVLVVDGIHHNSNFYSVLSKNLSAWGETNTAVFVGAASEADLPNDPKSYQRLVSRIAETTTI